MFQNSQLFISFKHIQAKTPKQLENQMLQIQVNAGKGIDFTPPTFNGGNWHTWYLHDHSEDIRPQDRLLLGNK